MNALRTVIGNALAIYRRELQSYLASPLAYIIAGIFWLLGGFFLVVILFSPEGLLAQVAQRDQALQMGVTLAPLDVAYEFLQGYFGVIGSLSMFVLPILAMGLYAEERKQGTLELLATSPVMNWVVALGKLLAVVTFYIGMVLPLMLCVAIALGTADPAVAPNLLLVGNLGLILLAASVLSLGMFLSSLTSSSVVAAILTFALVIFLWIVDALARAIPGWLGDALNHLSMLQHFTAFTQGVLDTSSIILFCPTVYWGCF